MFAVPGWNVPADKLVRHNDDVAGPEASKAQAARKRKREHDLVPSRKISSVELEKLWNSKFQETKKSKKIKKERNGAGSNRTLGAHAVTVVEDTQDAEPDMKIPRAEQGISPKKDKSRDGRTQTRQPQPQKTSNRKDGDHSKHSESATKTTCAASTIASSLPPAPPTATKLTPLQLKMRSKLTSARFRHLNEALYTTPSASSLALFSQSPDLFTEYHAGFSQQVRDSWPENPVDLYIRQIKSRGAVPLEGHKIAISGILPLPRRKTGSCTVADLGCGDAPLARGCQSVTGKLKLKFHSYDLHAPNSHVTVADISELPLRDGEVDIAVFCLSLMGTNWISFVEEAWRILRGDGKGEVWVAEVKSRFGRVKRGVVENSVGHKKKKKQMKEKQGDDEDSGLPDEEVFAENEQEGDEKDETDISAFVQVFLRRGFQLRENSVVKRNKMFVSMVFTKSGIPTAGKHKGLRWNGKAYERVSEKSDRVKFIDTDKDRGLPTPDEEAKVLKPCVYKVR